MTCNLFFFLLRERSYGRSWPFRMRKILKSRKDSALCEKRVQQYQARNIRRSKLICSRCQIIEMCAGWGEGTCAQAPSLDLPASKLAETIPPVFLSVWSVYAPMNITLIKGRISHRSHNDVFTSTWSSFCKKSSWVNDAQGGQCAFCWWGD